MRGRSADPRGRCFLKVAQRRMGAGWYVRSAIDFAREEVAQRLASVGALAEAEAICSGQYFGWKPNPASPILDVHSPSERLEASSVQQVYDLRADTLKAVPEK